MECEGEPIGLSDKKQTSTGTSSSTASYGYQVPPSTPALDKLRSDTFEVDPGIAAQYGKQRADLNASFHQPTGAFLPPAVRDAQMRSGNERLGVEQANAQREGQFDVNKLNFARDQAVAGMSAPQLTQTGTSGTQQGTTIQSQSPWSTIAQVGASAAPLSL